VYEQIDGNPDGMFSPKAGLLLDMRLHRAYDALSWSFYRKVSNLCLSSPGINPALIRKGRHILRALFLPHRPMAMWPERQSYPAFQIPRAKRTTRPCSSRLALCPNGPGPDQGLRKWLEPRRVARLPCACALLACAASHMQISHKNPSRSTYRQTWQ